MKLDSLFYFDLIADFELFPHSLLEVDLEYLLTLYFNLIHQLSFKDFMPYNINLKFGFMLVLFRADEHFFQKLFHKLLKLVNFQTKEYNLELLPNFNNKE